MREAAVLILSYFLGSIPVGLITGKITKGIDIRDYGSGNIGATNVLRTLGRGPATIVMVGDTLKGYVAVKLAMTIHAPYWPYMVIAAGLLSIFGHSLSPFLRFKGGKGVATSLGVIIGMNPLIALIAFVLWVSIVAITRYVSIASIFAPFTVPIMMCFSKKWFGADVPKEFAVFGLAASTLILIRHVSNIKRLLNGTEPKIGQKVKLEENDSDGAG
jgi:glycerol-3-phosphate acyltransferase PlsY